MPEKREILIVDDNQGICEVVSEFLVERGFNVECANNGAEAIRLLAERSFDIAVVDLLLGGKVTSEEVIIRANYLHIPVVTMSGALASDPQGRDLKTVHLPKPFRTAQLLSIIERLLGSAG